MSEVVNPQVGITKQKAREFSERTLDRHAPDVVSQFVQFSLGVASLNRLFGEDVDLTQIMRSGAKLAAHNLYPHQQEQVATDLLADEWLCVEIEAADLELRARGGDYGDGD